MSFTYHTNRGAYCKCRCLEQNWECSTIIVNTYEDIYGLWTGLSRNKHFNPRGYRRAELFALPLDWIGNSSLQVIDVSLPWLCVDKWSNNCMTGWSLLAPLGKNPPNYLKFLQESCNTINPATSCPVSSSYVARLSTTKSSTSESKILNNSMELKYRFIHLAFHITTRWRGHWWRYINRIIGWEW